MNIYMNDVNFQYERDKKILHNISTEIEGGESVGLIGANGAGKFTLLKILVGLNTDFEGLVKVGDLELRKENVIPIRKAVGYVFQDSDSQLFMPTAFEDIAFGPRNQGLSEEEVSRRVEAAMKLIDIERLRDKQIYKMSGGEKKMVAIATVISMLPEIIVLDEPTIALDPKNRRRIINLLNSIEKTKIIATHDLDMVLDTCNRTILLAGGKIVAEGPTSEILRDRELLEINGLELPLSMQ